ncbi:MAG: hypothetical protein QNJ65_08055 [Xenococcaceae cyanobacterium MO_234.B1]|nr:hypothetical protein [Xenococcaceae cyanobacterium MO_234.B1]
MFAGKPRKIALFEGFKRLVHFFSSVVKGKFSMFDNNSTVKSRSETENNNPLNNDVIWSIEHGEISLEEILAYQNSLASYLRDGLVTKPGYY